MKDRTECISFLSRRMATLLSSWKGTVVNRSCYIEHKGLLEILSVFPSSLINKSYFSLRFGSPNNLQDTRVVYAWSGALSTILNLSGALSSGRSGSKDPGFYNPWLLSCIFSRGFLFSSFPGPSLHTSQVCTIEVVQCTAVKLSYCILQLYSCTVVQLYSCTVVQLYSCTVAQLHSCIVAQFYSWQLHCLMFISCTDVLS